MGRFFESIANAVGELIRESVRTAAAPAEIAPTDVAGETSASNEVDPSLPGAVAKPRQGATRVAKRWTTKSLVEWINKQFGRMFSRETIRKVLHRAKLSWKKAKKLLGRANPEKRQTYLDQLKPLLEEASVSDEALLVYMDEAHIHQDTDLGYAWSIQGEPFWVHSTTPGLSEKASFYGVYLYSESQVRIWPYERANGENTIDVLRRLRAEFPERRIRLIWDGAPYHRSGVVRDAAAALSIELVPLPGYSPDLMPVEHLWDWFREEVTRNHCHTTRDELLERANAFERKLNASPCELADRLWVADELDQEVEKLRIPR